METIQVQGRAGKIVFFPSKISEKCLRLIEKQLKKIISTVNDNLSANQIRTILKDKDPLIGTPGGTLKAYRARAEKTQQSLAKVSGIKQSHLSEMERNQRPIGVKVAKKLAQVLQCDYRRLL